MINVHAQVRTCVNCSQKVFSRPGLPVRWFVSVSQRSLATCLRCKSTTQIPAWKAIISYRPTNRPTLLEFVRQTVQLPALSPHKSTQKQSDKVLSAQRLTRLGGIRKRPVRVLALHFGYRIIDSGASKQTVEIQLSHIVKEILGRVEERQSFHHALIHGHHQVNIIGGKSKRLHLSHFANSRSHIDVDGQLLVAILAHTHHFHLGSPYP